MKDVYDKLMSYNLQEGGLTVVASKNKKKEQTEIERFLNQKLIQKLIGFKCSVCTGVLFHYDSLYIILIIIHLNFKNKKSIMVISVVLLCVNHYNGFILISKFRNQGLEFLYPFFQFHDYKFMLRYHR